MAGTFTRILQWWFRSQMTDLIHQISVVEKTIAQIPAPARNACQEWLDTASKVTKKPRLGYSQFDEAWSALHEIRHICCRHAQEDSLGRIAEEVASDLVYVTDKSRKDHSLADVARLQTKLHAALQKTPPSKKTLSKLCADLLRLSIIGAGEREAQWHRVNLLRGRLMFTAFCLTLLSLALVAVLFWWPNYLGINSKELQEYNLARVPAIIGFGAVGGLLSALRQREPLAGISSLFYIERMLLYLRPLVGAVAALIIYIAQLSGLVTVAGNSSSATYFFVAFCAGFSERFFLRHLSKFLQREKKKGVSKDADGPAATTGG